MGMHTVVETPTFLRQAKAAGVTEAELDAIKKAIAKNPQSGAIVPGTGGARKLRFAPAGRGKRGGYRTIHYYAADDVPVFLLTVLSKGQRADLSRAEQNQLRRILSVLADEYRKNTKAKVRQIRRR